jgi:hypothetical protein
MLDPEHSSERPCPTTQILPARTTPPSWRVWREDRHYLHVPALAFRADKIEQPGNVNEDRFFWQPYFIECHSPPMPAALALK